MTLSAEGVSVRFGGVRALSEVDLSVERGQIVGIVGPNGAGKSTLFNCVTGLVRPEHGRVVCDGADITSLRPDRRVRRGIGRSFQMPRLDLQARVVDVVALGFYARYRQWAFAAFLNLPSVRAQEEQVQRRAVELIERIGITTDPYQRSGELSMGQLRLVEVARALATGARYLLLDECAAGVDEHDRRRLADTIREAAGDGIGVLLVEHDFGWLRSTSDRLAVLVQGEVLAVGDPDAVAADPRVTAAYLGEDYDD